MFNRTDVRWAQRPEWANADGRATGVSLEQIHGEATRFSRTMRDWYWNSIRQKRVSSVAARSIAFVLGALGALSPLVVGVVAKEGQRLWVTQAGIVMVTTAGLVLAADKAFGWSSGWLRYTTTVIAMEQLTMQFDVDWAALMLKQSSAARPNPLEGSTPPDGAGRDVSTDTAERAVGGAPVHDVPAERSATLRDALETARVFMQKLEALRSEETQRWIAEFNSGMAALDEMVKKQREEGERARETLATSTAAKAAEARAGAIVLELTQAGPQRRPCTVALDDGSPEPVTGSSWAKLGVPAGPHRVRVTCDVEGGPARESSDIVEVEPGKVTRGALAVS